MSTELVIIGIEWDLNAREGRIPRVAFQYGGLGGYGMSQVVEEIMVCRPDLLVSPDSKVEQYYIPNPKAFLEHLAAHYNTEVEQWGGGLEGWAQIWSEIEKHPNYAWWMHVEH